MWYDPCLAMEKVPMQVQIEDVSPVEKKLSVEIPWETVKARLASAYDELAKTVSLKGFRKGKVPRSVVQQMFGKQVRAEVAGQLVRDSLIQAVTEHSIEIVSEPAVHDAPIESGKPFSFHAHVEVRAPIQLDKKDYEGLELRRTEIEIDDAAVQQALEQIQRDHTDLEPIEDRDVTAKGDVLLVEVEGTVGDETLERKRMPVELDGPEVGGVPGLGDRLTGVPLDATDLEFAAEIPPREGDADAKPTPVRLKVSIVEARRKVVPAIDDDLAKETGEADTLEELREVVRARLEERAEEAMRESLREQALAKLVEKNPIPVASGPVRRAVEGQVARFRKMLGDSDEVDYEAMRGRLSNAAADDFRGELLLDEIARLEGIEVTEEEIDDHVARLAKYEGKLPNRLRAELERDGRIDRIRFELRRRKTLDLLVDRAHVEVVTAEEAAAEAAAAEAGAPPAGGAPESAGADDSDHAGGDAADSGDPG
ncbi:MAG: trigger factor [Deltaproteobacteria bacterium]|nr:MAG: trigger factor [Deltaproteobacteria bacterium]